MKARTNIVLIISCLVGLLMSAQTIKTKKGKLLYDGKEVALVENTMRDHYVFSTLSGEKQFTAQLDGEAYTADNIMHYLKVSNADDSIATEVEYEVLVTAFSVERIIAHLLAVKYHLIDENGINAQNLEDFFAQEREKLGDKYKAIVV